MLKFAKSGSVLLLTGVLAVLVWLSFGLAGNRIYQVDECENIYVSKILAAGKWHDYFTNLTLLQFPLQWVTHGAVHAADYFASGRFLMLEIFWLNLVLIALAAGERLLSLRGLIALLGAATLAPLWDYGFEIRHDNLLLSGLLLMWCVIRLRPAGMQSYCIAGALAAALQFVAFKAFVYTLPISLAILVFPPAVYRSPRWKLVLSWVAGAIATFALMRIIYGATGLWGLFVSDLHRVFGDATGNNRFAPWETLSRLLTQTPLLLAVAVAGLIAVAADLRRRGWAALTWQGLLPEALMLLVVVGALIINPTPFAYNLLYLVPFAFIFAFRYAAELCKDVRERHALVPAAAAIILFAHVVPFEIATRRHWDMTNHHQEGVMKLAEEMTDPDRDPVYDGIGLVPTRHSIHYQWFLHSLNIQKFINGQEMPVRDMLASNPAAVIIPSYRTDWLPEADHAFIGKWYVPLEDDFWVLGKILPAGGGDLEIIHPGRYRITSLEASNIEGTFSPAQTLAESLAPEPQFPPLTGTLDGAPLDGKPVELTVGKHHLECAAQTRAAVVWLGPNLDTIARLRGGDHRWLFVNWY
jgi:hypothetical protein